MRIIHTHCTDPYFNLATEEALLETASDDIFMIWQNSASVIIGKNQDAWAEVNTDYTTRHSIPVVRRLTGGGAVFHDPGNINFTFITGYSGEEMDFSRFTSPVIETLSTLGIRAESGGRNDILANGVKISGNAEAVFRRRDGESRLLHHGTLLYDADMTHLAAALSPDREKLTSKGISSVSSRVQNIKSIGALTLTPEEFASRIAASAEARYHSVAGVLTPEEEQLAAVLCREKYSTWEWNFGRSPLHGETRRRRFPWGSLTASLVLERGTVTSLQFSGDYFCGPAGDSSLLESALTGVPFERDSVSAVLSALEPSQIILGCSAEDLLLLLGLSAE